MHINHLWAILRQHPEYDFLAASTNRQRAKNIITRLILNTDMSLHNKNLDKLKKLTFNNDFDPKRNYEHKWVTLVLFSFWWSKYFMHAILAILVQSTTTISVGMPFSSANLLNRSSYSKKMVLKSPNSWSLRITPIFIEISCGLLET